MANAKFTRPFPAWKEEPFIERIERCRAVLAIHGFIAEKESHKIRGRIVKASKTKETADVE